MDNFAQEFNGMAIMDTTDALCQQVTHALDNELRPSMQLIGAAIGHKKRLQTSINDKVLQITTLDTEFDGNLANAKARYLDPAYLLKILSLNGKLKEDNEKEMAQIQIMQTKISSKSILLEEIATLEFELAEATARKEQEEKEEQERIEQLALLNQQNQIAPEVSSAQELELSSPELPPPVQLAEPLPGTSSAPISIALNQNEIIESTSEEAPLPQQKKKKAAKKKPTTNVEIATSSSELQPQQVIPKPKEASKSKKKAVQVVPDPQPVAETYIMQDIRTRLRVRSRATITYADSTTPEIPKQKRTRTVKKKATEPINSPVASTSQQSATPVATKKKAPKGRKATKSTATGSNSARRSITPLEVPELVESPMNPKPAARGGRKKVTIVEPVPDSTSALESVDPQPSSSGSSNSNLTNAATQTPKKTKTNKRTAKKV